MRCSAWPSGPRALAPALLACVIAGCADDPGLPPRAAASPATDRAGTVRAAEAMDPAEPGISPLASLSRQVYYHMLAHRERCSLAGLPAVRFGYVIEVEVAGGRVAAAGLASVTSSAGAAPRLLERRQWPRALREYVACMQPHLKALELDPAPPDGSYETEFSVIGTGEAAPSR